MQEDKKWLIYKRTAYILAIISCIYKIVCTFLAVKIIVLSILCSFGIAALQYSMLKIEHGSYYISDKDIVFKIAKIANFIVLVMLDVSSSYTIFKDVSVFAVIITSLTMFAFEYLILVFAHTACAIKNKDYK